ncbi:DNA/RNA nuclease SfsA [Oricola thermophila]|uniref:Sugar fermentation stimulation protein homolog n=1 Tax=Oricola thermophila TaxID=2742145 RepID=A0A6N1VEZ7_9HYPH|nr:DNA/RNA nuclease SfsA [Oricola thermophila]QKV17792.1 DNA/RNA nuclease SfsA [Oricola thermophila]
MKFPAPLVPGRLERRYKRFLADVHLEDGTFVTCAVPNTGSMMGLTDPGSRVWLSTSDNPKRKYRHTLEIVEADGTMVGVNTGLPNRLVEEAIRAGMIADLADFAELKREQKYGMKSRIDILLSDPAKGLAYVEVKNVHMMRIPGLAEFPDTVTARGARHLDEMADMVRAGHRAAMVYLVQRSDCSELRLCRDLDPAYCAAFDRAASAGVEAFAIRCQITPNEIIPEKTIPLGE